MNSLRRLDIRETCNLQDNLKMEFYPKEVIHKSPEKSSLFREEADEKGSTEVSEEEKVKN